MPWGDTHRKASLRSRRVRNRQRLRRILRVSVVLFVCAGFLAGVWYATRMKLVTITTVAVSGDITIDPRAVEREVQSALHGTYFLLIPKRFAYTYPHDALTTAVERMSHIARATITRTSSTALSVALVEYTPYALWCNNKDGGQDSGEECLYVSEEGFAFAKAPLLKGATFLRYVTEDRNPEIGVPLVSAEQIRATKAFIHALKQKHTMYVSMIQETNDGDMRYRVREGGELLVAKNADMQKVSENLDAVLASPEFKHITSGNFDYIDLRFDDKIFVKEFRDTEQ